MTKMQQAINSSSRGFLRNCPKDVVYVVNGKLITKCDILDAKRARQRRILAAKRRLREPVVKPCFVWVFYNESWIYHGWWLYVKTLKYSWGINLKNGRYSHFTLEIMRMFPCGYLPFIENFTPWMAAFADRYHYPTQKRPDKQGMAVAQVKVSPNGDLLNIKADIW